MPYHLIGGVKTISKNIFSAQEFERSRLFDPEFTTPFLFFFFNHLFPSGAVGQIIRSIQLLTNSQTEKNDSLTFLSLSSSSLMESFCSSAIKSFVAMKRKSLSVEVI